MGSWTQGIMPYPLEVQGEVTEYFVLKSTIFSRVKALCYNQIYNAENNCMNNDIDFKRFYEISLSHTQQITLFYYTTPHSE